MGRRLLYRLRAFFVALPLKLLYSMLYTRRGRQITLSATPFAVLIVATLALVLLIVLVGPWLGAIIWIAAITALGALILLRRARKERLMFSVARELTDRLDPDPDQAASWQRWQVSSELRNKVEKALDESDGPLVLGSIDRYGRTYSPFGELPSLSPVNREDFIPRVRFALDIVIRGDRLLLQKDFAVKRPSFVTRIANRLRRGPTEWSYSHKKSFGRDWYFLALLKEAGAEVPRVVNADEDNYVLEIDFITGKTVEELIESKIAVDPTASLDSQKEIVRTSSSSLVQEVLPPGFIDQLRKQLDLAHSLGVVSIDMSYQHILVHPVNSNPVEVDFERTMQFSRTGKLFHHKRDRDRRDFNRLYGTDLMAERDARRELGSHSWNEPMDLGLGLTVGRYWSTHSGTGQWECEIDPVIAEFIRDRTVLDLSGGDGLYACLLSRSGARHVVAVVDGDEQSEKCELLKRIFEWRAAHGLDLEVVDSPPDDRFDVVTCMSAGSGCTERQRKELSQTETAILQVKQADCSRWAKQLREFGLDVEREVKLAGGSVLLFTARRPVSNTRK